MERQIKRMENEVEAARMVVERMENQVLVARKFLQDRLHEYAQLHFEGASVAAAKGDTRPAEWALTHAKIEGEAVVEPPAKEAPDTGLKIYIGVPLAQLPASAIGDGVIDVKAVEAESEGGNYPPSGNNE